MERFTPLREQVSPFLSPNRTCGFPRIRLSSDYGVVVVAGCRAWIRSWQGVQTIRVLRRLSAMICAHAGGGCPVRARSASLGTWWISTLARCSQSSHRPARSRVTSSLGRGAEGAGSRSVRTAVFCRRSGMPPNRATSGFLPARSTVASKHRRGPWGVTMVVLCLSAIFVTVERCFAASVLSMEVFMTHSSRSSR